MNEILQRVKITTIITTSSSSPTAAGSSTDNVRVYDDLAQRDDNKEMAVLRGIRRRLRQANPCTTFLCVLLFAVIVFLISASRENRSGSVDAESSAGDRRLSGVDGADDKSSENGRHRRRKLKGSYFIVGDDEVQICQMTPAWSKSGSDEWNQRSADTAAGRHHQPQQQLDCADGAEDVIDDGTPPPSALFYIDDAGLLRRNTSKLGERRGGWEIVEDSCRVEEIRWKSDREYETRAASEDSRIGSEFVRIHCRLRRLHRDVAAAQTGGEKVDKIENADEEDEAAPVNDHHGQLRKRRGASPQDAEVSQEQQQQQKRKREEAANQVEEKANDLHRESIRRQSPGIVGSIGLPDPPSEHLFAPNRHPLSTQSEETEKQALKKPEQKLKPGVESSDADQVGDGENKKINRKPVAAAAAADNVDDSAAQPRNVEKPRLVVSPKSRDVEAEKSKEKSGNQLPVPVATAAAAAAKISTRKQVADNDDDFVTVDYDQFIAFVRPSKEVLEPDDDDLRKRRDVSKQPNVLILVLDSVSRFSLDRNLPKTRALLADRLHAVVMDGYNVLGDAAADNIIPLLTGHNISRWKDIRFQGEEVTYVDSMPLIWNKFEQDSYTTLYAEDQPELGTFQLDFHGFEAQPVHHYMRPFWLAAADYIKQKRKSSVRLAASDSRRRQCLVDQPEHEYLFRYVEDFFVKYDKVPRFAVAFLSDVVSDAEPTVTHRFDADLERFLDGLLLRRRLAQNTVVIVVSDHGPSHGPRRHTLRGSVEERQPLLAVVLSETLRTKFPQLAVNLDGNKDRLTTPLDVHATLVDLLNIETLGKVGVAKDSSSISLLRPIPINRSCRSASVDVHWCMCTYFQLADVSGDVIPAEWQRTGEYVVGEINELLRPADGRCLPLKLEIVLSAKYIIPSDLVIDSENKYYYGRQLYNFTGRHPNLERYLQIVVQTSPNGATFEATIVHQPRTEHRRITGQISRISSYGDEPSCIVQTHPQLRKYCACA